MSAGCLLSVAFWVVLAFCLWAGAGLLAGVLLGSVATAVLLRALSSDWPVY